MKKSLKQTSNFLTLQNVCSILINQVRIKWIAPRELQVFSNKQKIRLVHLFIHLFIYYLGAELVRPVR